MRIKLNNIGPIRRATLDQKQLTMLVGRNNTGKSMAMVALYAALGQASVAALGYMRRSIRMLAAEYEDGVASQPFLELAGKRSKPAVERLPSGLLIWLESATSVVLRNYGLAVVDELQRTTGASLRQLRRSSPRSKGPASITVSNDSPSWRIRISLVKGKPRVVVEQPSVEDVWEKVTASDWTRLQERIGRPVPSRRHPVEDLVTEYLSTCFRSMPRRVYYLPAARSGTMAIHRELVRDLVRRATSPSGRVESGLVMTGVMADFLGEMISLEPHDGDFKDEAAELEREVLHGRLELRTERDGSQQALYANDAGSFELHRASSMVQELTPVVLYLKHLLKKSDLLLIEEPEAHLHPQAQTAFARAMVRLVNAGLMICLTTHSEFLLSEINNRIAAHRIGTVDARRLGISSTLDPERVGAYLFHPAEDGTAVERLTISAEDGISEDAFADVVAELYDESVRLERAAQR